MEDKQKQQAAFDKAYKGVMAQGRKSSGEFSCAYYLEVDGKECRCNVGHLVSLEEAKELQTLYPQGTFLAIHREKTGRALASLHGGYSFLNQLQQAHDCSDDEKDYLPQYRENMTRLAADYGLSTEVMTMSEVKDLLIKARALLEKGWTQGALCRDSEGEEVYPSQDPHSVCTVCLMGALAVPFYQETGFSHCGPGYTQASTLLEKVIFGGVGLIAAWNDDPKRTKEEVLAVVDKALALAEVDLG